MLSERTLSELQELLVELDRLISKSGSEIAPQAHEAAQRWRAKLTAALKHFGTLRVQAQQQLSETAKSAEQLMHDSPWRLVSIAMAAGVVIGLALGARRGPSSQGR
ncbi:MAG: hypothetical protein WAN26_12130 [Steroidobacteraceae bacterium]